jgi:hypothetical protein
MLERCGRDAGAHAPDSFVPYTHKTPWRQDAKGVATRNAYGSIVKPNIML